MNFLAWCVQACETGVRPRAQHDLAEWPAGSVFADTLDNLAARFLLVQLKGDWVELTKSLGFPSFGSIYGACLWCSTLKDGMHDYDDMSVDNDPWDGPEDYHAACRTCEIVVLIESERQRQLVFVEGGLEYDKRERGSRGRALQHDVPELVGRCGRALRAGDKLSPSLALLDVGRFRRVAPPVLFVFWRRHTERISSTVLLDSVV